MLKNGRFVAGALATGFVSLPLLAWIAQSPVIIISGEQLSSYEYGLLQVPIFGALIIGNFGAGASDVTPYRAFADYFGRLAHSGRADYRGGGDRSLVSCVPVDDGGAECLRVWYRRGECWLVRLTLFASEMSKGTVSAAMGMLQMLIFTVGIEVSKHAYAFGGNGLFSLFNLANGVLWVGLMVVFLKDKRVGSALQP